MSKSKAKKANAKTLSEQKTLPIAAPDARASKTNAARQNSSNIKRTKHWGDAHKS